MAFNVHSFPTLQKNLYFSLECSEYTERQSDIKDNSRESWAHSAVESERTFLHHYLSAAVREPRIFVRINSLHPCLDHINRIVGKHGDGSGESTRHQVAEHLGRDDILKLLGSLCVNQEANTLIR